MITHLSELLPSPLTGYCSAPGVTGTVSSSLHGVGFSLVSSSACSYTSVLSISQMWQHMAFTATIMQCYIVFMTRQYNISNSIQSDARRQRNDALQNHATIHCSIMQQQVHHMRVCRWVYGRSPRGSNSGLSGSRSYRRNSRPLSASSTGSQGLSISGDLGSLSAMDSSRSGDSFTGLHPPAASRPLSGIDMRKR